MTTRRWAILAAAPLALAGFTLGTGGTHAQSAAGAPTPEHVLLCGLFTPGTDNFSGASNIDHQDGASSSGNIYQYHGQTCEQEENQNDSIGTYTWTVSHSNVHAAEAGTAPQAEFGTEHVAVALSIDGGQAAGANGRVTNFDLSTNDSDGDPCTASDGSNRSIFYASGSQDTQNNCSPGGPGNFNTHGGASTGNHFRGIYGTTVYQDQDTTNTGSQCNASLGSVNDCFEGVINGQVN